MKLMSLNVWGGRRFDPLMEYLRKVSLFVDVFCFQEVFATDTEREWSDDRTARVDLMRRLSEALPSFVGIFAPALRSIDYQGPVSYDLRFGVATFVRKNIQVLAERNIFIFGHEGMHEENPLSNFQRNMLCLLIADGATAYTLLNLHGLWIKGSKNDTPERIGQSWNIRQILDNAITDQKIVCGDFNLAPDTISLSILQNGMRNLVVEHGISTTRSSLYPGRDRYADYILTSRSVTIHDFEVDKIDISDHLPLLIQCY